jgi:hypothetical protein
MARADSLVAGRIRYSGAAFWSHAAVTLQHLMSWLTDTGYKPERHYMRGGRLCEERRASGSWQDRSQRPMPA